MKFTKYITLLAAAAGLTVACQKLEMVQAVDPSQVVAPVLQAIDPIVVTPETLGNKVEFEWTKADYGVATQVDYALEVALPDGEKTELKSGLHTTSLELTYEVLNERLLYGVKLDANVEATVHFFVSAKMGNTAKVYSEPVAVNVTPSVAERVYPMVYVIGDFNGWADGTTQELFDFAGDDAEYSGMVGFGGKAAKGFKVRGSAIGWDNTLGNWGLNGDETAPEKEAPKIPLYNDGGSGNINVYEKDFYNFTLVKATPELKVNFSFNSVGVIGDAVGGWGEDKDMNFSTTKQLFWLDVELVEGPMKFRADDDWALNWGLEAENADPVKSGALAGDKNIKVPAGNYRVYLDLRNPAELSFSLSSADYGTANPDGDTPVEPEPEPEPEAVEAWSLIGSITEWKSDIIMTNLNGLWLAKDVEFAEGADFKVRWKQSWDEPNPNYGMVEGTEMIKVGEETKLAKGGANIKLDKAGTYNVSFNPETEMIKVYVEGTEPEPVVSEWGIVGTINNWGNTPGVKDLILVQEGDYFVHKNLVLTDTDEVKFRKNNAWGGDVTADPSVCKPNVTIELAGGQGNMKFVAGTYDVYINADCSQCWFMTDGKTPADAEGPIEPEPEPTTHTWSVIGAPDFQTDVDMVDAEGIWTAYGVELKANAGFKIRADKDWKLSYGAEGNDDPTVLALDQATKVTSANGKNMAVAADGKYDIIFDVANETVTVKTATEEPVKSIWGIVGTINEWGKTPDKELIKEGDYFVHKGLVLTDSDLVKFRKNNTWGGDMTADPALCAANTTILLAEGQGNMKLPAGTYDVYIDANCTKAWFMTDGKTPADAAAPIEPKPEPEPDPEPVVETWGLVGAYTGWGDSKNPDYKEDIKLTEKEGGIWTLENFELATDKGFKFRVNNDWAKQLGNLDGKAIKAGVEVTLSTDGGSGDLKPEVAGKYNIILNPAAKTLKLELIGDPIIPEPEPSNDTWALIGSFTNWADMSMNSDGNGLWTLESVEIPEGAIFKFRANSDWDKQLGATSADPVEPAENIALSDSNVSDNISLTKGGTYKITLNPAAKTVNIELIGDPATPDPAKDTWAICGEFNGWTDTAMTDDGEGKWSIDGIEIPANSKFKFRANGAWDKQFGAPNADPINPMGFVTLSSDKNSTDITLSRGGKFKFVLDTNSGKLMIFPK